KKYLRSFLDAPYTDWESLLTSIRFCYNTSVSKATQKTPFSLVYGIDPHMPFFDLEKYIDYDETKSNADHLQCLWAAREEAKHHNMEYKQVYKEYYDRKAAPTTLSKNSQVFLSVPPQQKEKNAKLHKKYAGPYLVVEMDDKTALLANSGKRLKSRVSIDRLKPAFPSTPTQQPLPTSPATPKSHLETAEKTGSDIEEDILHTTTLPPQPKSAQSTALRNRNNETTPQHPDDPNLTSNLQLLPADASIFPATPRRPVSPSRKELDTLLDFSDFSEDAPETTQPTLDESDILMLTAAHSPPDQHMTTMPPIASKDSQAKDPGATPKIPTIRVRSDSTSSTSTKSTKSTNSRKSLLASKFQAAKRAITSPPEGRPKEKVTTWGDAIFEPHHTRSRGPVKDAPLPKTSHIRQIHKDSKEKDSRATSESGQQQSPQEAQDKSGDV
ncbi:MAG: hypothetical protein AAGJ35_10775, partial [Myxococcota bacterium]